MIKLVHIFDLDRPDVDEPILVNFNNVNYMRNNYDFNCTNIYFSDGSGIIIKENISDLLQLLK